MATFKATFSKVSTRADTGSTMPVMKGRGAIGMTPLTTGAGAAIVQNAADNADWLSPGDGFVTMRCSGAVWVQIAAAPMAAVATDSDLQADERFEVAVESGDKISVIDA